jgi:hypothetical protein
MREDGVLATVIAVLLLAPASSTTQTFPRTADGKPNLSGVWQVVNTANWDLQAQPGGKGIPAGQGVVEGDEIPYQPAALEKKKQNFEKRATADPETKCDLPGVPRITYMPYPFRIVQTPKQVSMLSEYVHTVRNIFMDSQHPKGAIEWWMGDSRGHWEGDTLVIDVIDFNSDTWFDKAGDFHSTGLHVVERYTPIDATHLNYEATIEDPAVFTRPWKIRMPLYKRIEADVQILEYECYVYDIEERAHANAPAK